MVKNGRMVRWARGAVCAAAFAAAAFTLPVAHAWAAGADSVPELRSQTQTQMSSAPEVSYVSNVSDPTRRTVSFNDNWKFNLGDASGAQAAVRGEEGCLQYDYFTSVDDPDKLLLLEKWTTREAQKVHMGQPHMALIQEVKDRCAADTILETYDLP